MCILLSKVLHFAMWLYQVFRVQYIIEICIQNIPQRILIDYLHLKYIGIVLHRF